MRTQQIRYAPARWAGTNEDYFPVRPTSCKQIEAYGAAQAVRAMQCYVESRRFEGPAFLNLLPAQLLFAQLLFA